MYQYRTKILHDVSVCLLTNHVSQISGWLIRGRPPFPPKIGTATGPLPPLPYFRHCWCCFEIRWQDCARETVFPLHVTSRTSRIFMYWEPAFILYCPALVTLNITLQSAWLRTNLTCSTSCPGLVGLLHLNYKQCDWGPSSHIPLSRTCTMTESTRLRCVCEFHQSGTPHRELPQATTCSSLRGDW